MNTQELKNQRNVMIKSLMKHPAMHNSEKKKRYLKSFFKSIDNSNLPTSAQVMIEVAFTRELIKLCTSSKKPVTLFELDRLVKKGIVDDIETFHIRNLEQEALTDEGAKSFVERIKSDSALMLIQRAKLTQQFKDILKPLVETYSDEFWALDKHVCSICQTTVDSKDSHNPEPLNEGRCCENCNEAVVQYRVSQMFSQMKQQKETMH